MKFSFKWLFKPKSSVEEERERNPERDPEGAREGNSMSSQFEALEKGEEIEPPWIEFPGSESWNFKQGTNQAWMRRIWRPYWKRLTEEERHAYLERWPPPGWWRDALFSKLTYADNEERGQSSE